MDRENENHLISNATCWSNGKAIDVASDILFVPASVNLGFLKKTRQWSTDSTTENSQEGIEDGENDQEVMYDPKQPFYLPSNCLRAEVECNDCVCVIVIVYVCAMVDCAMIAIGCNCN